MAANNKEEKKLNPFVEGVLGLASLALITVVGFFVFFAFTFSSWILTQSENSYS